MCRQSRLRGRIHARPSAGGLAVLCVSCFFFFSFILPPCSIPVLLSSSSRPPPAFPRCCRAGSLPLHSPGSLLGPISVRSPPTRSSRSPFLPPSPFLTSFARHTIYNSLGIARECESIECAHLLLPILRIGGPAVFDSGLTRPRFRSILTERQSY